MAGYIADGYTRPGYIKPDAGLHDGLRFSFRPMLVKERSDLNRAIDIAPDLETDLIGNELAKRITPWDLKDDKGAVLPINPATIAHMEPSLFWRLYGVVSRSKADDSDPKAPPASQSSQAEALVQALRDGTTLGQAEADAAGKKLADGLRLRLYKPEVGYLPCELCERWAYDPLTGKPVIYRTGPQAGKPVPRGKGKPPCSACPKCVGPPLYSEGNGLPAWDRNPQHGRKAELTPANVATLALYWEYQASRQPFDDAILAGHFAVIAEVFWNYQLGQQQRQAAILEALVTRR